MTVLAAPWNTPVHGVRLRLVAASAVRAPFRQRSRMGVVAVVAFLVAQGGALRLLRVASGALRLLSAGVGVMAVQARPGAFLESRNGRAHRQGGVSFAQTMTNLTVAFGTGL